jgi:hypothetical protein
MTKFTKLALIGASIMIVTASFITTGVVVAAANRTKTIEVSAAPPKDTIIVEKPVYIKPDTVRILVPCRKAHCELEVKPKPKPSDDSIISTQTTPQ